MKLITVVATLILAVGIFFGQRKIQKGTSKSLSQEVLSQESETPTEDSQTETSFYDLKSDSQPEDIESDAPSSTSTPTPSQTQENVNLQEYLYPNSEMLTSSPSFVSLKAYDDPDVITDWYKEKIRQLGLSVTTFVVTKTNDSVLNKLVGSSEAEEISIEIKKDASQDEVNIEVSLKP